MQRKNLTKLQREEFTLTQQQGEIVVGCILGDLNVEKDKRAINGNARLRFIQGTEHKEYLGELYEEFKDYCPHEPQIIKNKPDKTFFIEIFVEAGASGPGPHFNKN